MSTKSRRDRLVTLVAIARTLTSELEAPDVVHRILVSAMAVIPAADAGTLYLYDATNAVLVPTDAVGLGPTIYDLRIRPGEGMTGLAYQTQTPALYADAEAVKPRVLTGAPANLALFRDATGGTGYPHSAIVAPLLYKREALGVLTIENLRTSRAFDPFDLEIADALAQAAAVAIVNARLLEAERASRAALETVNEQMLADRRELEVRLDAQRRLLAMAEAEAFSWPALADGLCSVTGGQSYILDAVYRLLAAAPEPADDVLKRSPAEWAQLIQRVAQARRSRAVIVPDSSGEEIRAVSVVAGGDLLGYVAVEPRGGNLGRLEDIALRTAAMIAASEFLQQRRDRVSGARRADDLLHRMLAGERVTEMPKDFDLRPPLRLAVVRATPSTRGAVLSDEDRLAALSLLVRDRAAGLHRPPAVCTHEGHVVMLWGSARPELDARVKKMLDRAIEDLAHRHPGLEASAAISGDLLTIDDVIEAYRDARILLELRSRSTGVERMFEITRIGALGLVLQASRTEDVVDFARGALGAVAAHDRDHASGLVATLRVYLATGGNVRATAQQLGVHRHTVQYRLQRVRDLTGLNLNDGRDRLTLELALAILDLAGSWPGGPAPG